MTDNNGNDPGNLDQIVNGIIGLPQTEEGEEKFVDDLSEGSEMEDDEENSSENECSVDSSDDQSDPSHVILKEKARLRALRKSPLIVAMAQFKRLRTESPSLRADELVALEPDLKKSLSSVIVGWSKDGIILRSFLHMKNTHNALFELEKKANELIELERKYRQKGAIFADNSVCFPDEDYSEDEEALYEKIQRDEDAAVAEIVSDFLCDENTPQKKLRVSALEDREFPVDTEKTQQEDVQFFQDEQQQQRAKKLVDCYERRGEREANTFPLFRKECYTPSPLVFTRASNDDNQVLADGTYSELRDFVANKNLLVRGVNFGRQGKNKLQTELLSGSSEGFSSSSENEQDAEMKIPSQLNHMLNDLRDYDLVEWENDIIWDTVCSGSQLPSFVPAVSLATANGGNRKGERNSRRTEEERFFNPPDDYCNPFIESGEWVNSIAWEDKKEEEQREFPIVYDLNDPNIFFNVVPEGESTEKEERRRVLKAKMKKDASLNDEMVDKMFNVSHDAYYGMSKLKMKQRSGMSTINHGIPALNLSVFPTKMTHKDLVNFHRPKFVPDKNHLGPFNVNLGMNRKGLKPLAEHPEKLRYISAMSGDIMLLEHLERYPALISYVAMGSRLKTYYRKRSESDFLPSSNIQGEGEIVLLEPSDTSPFDQLGEVQPGTSVVTVENKMTKMPVARHTPADTDFLLVERNGSWSIRELGPLFLAGQEFPQMEVPVPGKNIENQKLRHWVEAFMIRTFMTSPAHTQFRTQEFLEAFDLSHDNNVRAFFQKYCDHGAGVAGTPSWEVRPDAHFPSESELQNLITPEEICAYNSMKHGAFMLAEEGIRYIFNEDDVQKLLVCNATTEQHEKLQQIHRAVSVTPWTTTSAFKEFLSGKDAIKLFGEGNPLVRAEGFSFVPVPVRSNRRRSELPKQNVPSGVDIVDLRTMKNKELEEGLLKRGHTMEEIRGLSRKELIGMLKTHALEEGDKRFERKIAQNNERNVQKQEECYELFERMLLSIRQTGQPVSEGVANLDDFTSELNILEQEDPAGDAPTTYPSSEPTPEPSSEMPLLEYAKRKISFRGRTRNPILPSKPVIPARIRSKMHGNRWRPDVSIVPHITMSNNVSIKRGRPRKNPDPAPVKPELVQRTDPTSPSHSSDETNAPNDGKHHHHRHHHHKKRPRLSDDASHVVDKLMEDGQLAWSDEIVNKISASNLSDQLLVDICRRRCCARPAEMELVTSIYELCWNIAKSDKDHAKDQGLELAISSCIKANDSRLMETRRKAVHSLLVCGRFKFCLDISSATYEPALKTGEGSDGVLAAEVEAGAVLGEIARRRRPPREFCYLFREAEDSGLVDEEALLRVERPRTTNPPQHNRHVGVKRTISSLEDDIVLPNEIQPPTKQSRESKPSSRTCVDESEDSLRIAFALPPRDGERVNSFMIHVPDMAEKELSDNKNTNSQSSTVIPNLGPCKVHLTFVPSQSSSVPTKIVLPVPSIVIRTPTPVTPAAVAASATTTAPPLVAPNTPVTPAPDAPGKLVLSFKLPATPVPTSTNTENSSGLRRSARAPHPTERFADILPPTMPSSSRKKTTKSSPPAPSNKQKSSQPQFRPQQQTTKKKNSHNQGESESGSFSSSDSSSDSSSNSGRHRHSHHHHHHHHHRR